MTEVLTVQIRVLFPNNATHHAGESVDVPAHEVLRENDDLASMSDATLVHRVEAYLDLPEGTMHGMIVQRPEAGNILITAKTRFGNFSCGYCGATFRNYLDLRNHLTVNPTHSI
jgi:hypothetical protein